MEKERADVKRRNTLELLTSRSLSSGRITVMIRVMSIIYHRTTLHPTCLSNPSNVGENHVGDVPLSKKIAAGFTTGALAIAVANLTDLVKVRLQSEGKLAPGVLRRYTGAMDAYAKIVRQEGVAALWTGLGLNVARNAIINAAELASYDQVKQSILKLPGFKDDMVTHILAGLGGAGFFAVCVGSLVDVVKSRMTQPTLVLLIVL